MKEPPDRRFKESHDTRLASPAPSAADDVQSFRIPSRNPIQCEVALLRAKPLLSHLCFPLRRDPNPLDSTVHCATVRSVPTEDFD